jgi:glycosyltransferase involved in cell wall biosynthesis
MDRRLLTRQLQEYEEADYICVPSRFALRSFLDQGTSPERLLHVPYGVDTRLFFPGHAPGRPFRILAVGASLRKGTPYLLEAVAKLQLRDVELWIAGAFPPEFIPVLSRIGTPFRHLGALSHADLAAAYRGASVFVLPSVEEGLSLAILEAMASGLPVVVTPNTGAEDIITGRREGILVPPHDTEALAGALLELYEDENLRRAMGEAAAQSAHTRTWDAYGDRVTRTYAQLVGHREVNTPQ